MLKMTSKSGGKNLIMKKGQVEENGIVKET